MTWTIEGVGKPAPADRWRASRCLYTVDLVVVASHGMTANYARRWGSVRQAILDKTAKPVLMVPARAD